MIRGPASARSTDSTGLGLAFGPDAGLVLSCDDAATATWTREFFGPALQPAEGDPGPRVRVESSADLFAELVGQRPAEAVARPCFAFDQSMLSLPTWEGERGLLAADARRSCMLAIRPSQVDLVGGAMTRRWRFTLVLVIHELVATRLRHRQLEIHAAGTEAGGRAILMVGPKGAGKTTLSFHLLRSGLVGWLANDRVFAGAEHGSITIRGVPTALKVRPATVAEFPELHLGVPEIERPYLYGVDEPMPPPEAEPRESEVLMLSPSQVARRLGAQRTASAPLGALVFPEVDTSSVGWSLERLAPEEVGTRIWANLFGDAARPRPATVFEELAGGRSEPDRRLAEEIAAAVPGFRATLGRGAYEDPDFAERFLATIAPGP